MKPKKKRTAKQRAAFARMRAGLAKWKRSHGKPAKHRARARRPPTRKRARARYDHDEQPIIIIVEE